MSVVWFAFSVSLKGSFLDYSQVVTFLRMTTSVLLSVTDYSSSSGAGTLILDNCNFHESVQLDSFDMDRTLSLVRFNG